MPLKPQPQHMMLKTVVTGNKKGILWGLHCVEVMTVHGINNSSIVHWRKHNTV